MASVRSQKRNVPVYLVFNKVSTHPNVKSVSDALDYMRESLIVPTHTLEAVVKDRIAYQHAIRDGMSVVEHKPVNRDARHEMKKAAAELLTLIHQSKSTEVT